MAAANFDSASASLALSWWTVVVGRVEKEDPDAVERLVGGGGFGGAKTDWTRVEEVGGGGWWWW